MNIKIMTWNNKKAHFLHNISTDFPIISTAKWIRTAVVNQLGTLFKNISFDESFVRKFSSVGLFSSNEYLSVHHHRCFARRERELSPLLNVRLVMSTLKQITLLTEMEKN